MDIFYEDKKKNGGKKQKHFVADHAKRLYKMGNLALVRRKRDHYGGKDELIRFCVLNFSEGTTCKEAIDLIKKKNILARNRTMKKETFFAKMVNDGRIQIIKSAIDELNNQIKGHPDFPDGLRYVIPDEED